MFETHGELVYYNIHLCVNETICLIDSEKCTQFLEKSNWYLSKSKNETCKKIYQIYYGKYFVLSEMWNFLVLILFFSTEVYPFFIKGNFYISAFPTQGGSNLGFNFCSKGRFQYNYFSMSNLNQSFNIEVYVNEKMMSYQVFQDKNFTLPLNSSGIFQVFDKNLYPYGFYKDDIVLEVVTNNTLFKELFNTTISIFMARKEKREFEFIEKISFNYSIDSFYRPVFNIGRYEAFELPIFIVICILLFILTILLGLFSQQQPLKSRGIVPILSCISHLISLLSVLPVFLFSLESSFKYLCLINSFIRLPSILIVLITSLIHFFRYIILINVNKRKMFIISSKKNDQNSEIKIHFKLLSYLGHWISNIIVLIFSYIIISLEFLFYFIYFNFQCIDANFNNIYNANIGVLTFFALILFILDFITNFQDIVKFRCSKLWKDDIFYFRIEIFGLVIGIALPFFVFRLIMDAAFPNPLSMAIFSSFSYYILYFGQFGFILIITMIATIKSAFSKNKLNDEIKVYLLDEEFHKNFKNFADIEFSGENLSCYDDTIEYSNIKDPKKKLEFLQKLHSRYLNGIRSELEVNVTKDISLQIKDAIESNNLPENLLEPLQKLLILNLSDTYSRFIFSKEYKNWVKSKTFLQESISLK